MATGFITSFISHPFDLIRTKLNAEVINFLKKFKLFCNFFLFLIKNSIVKYKGGVDVLR